MSVQVRLNLARLRRVIAGEKQAIERGVEKGAEQIAELARQLAPYETGELRESIHVEPASEGVVRVVADAPYAAYVEFGTRKMAAQPFLTPAVRHTNVLAAIATEMQELIR